MVIISLYFRKS